MPTFSEHLRAARLSANLSQEALAEAIGVARTNYIPYESGKHYPSLKTVPRLAKALGISMEEICSWVEEDNPND